MRIVRAQQKGQTSVKVKTQAVESVERRYLLNDETERY